MTDIAVGWAAAPVGPRSLVQQMKAGDGQADFFGDLLGGGLLRAAMLVDVTGDGRDPSRGCSPLEDEEPSHAGDEHPDAGVIARRIAGGDRGGQDCSPARWATTTSQLVTIGASGVVWA
ncbi:hypothetical protein GCM10018965_049850 [Nonomuraea roseola]